MSEETSGKLESSVISIEIQKCGLFDEDERFSEIRRALPSEESTDDPTTSKDEYDDNMDNVQFYDNRVEIVVNLKEYGPQDIKCNVTPDKIEVWAQRCEHARDEYGADLERSINISRIYDLPQKVNVNDTKCFLSSDGMLVIISMWAL